MADEKSSGESLPVEKLSKSQKKQARKQAKSRHTLLRHEGIDTSKLPTKHLIVGNGGLGNGVSRSELKPLFSQYGQLTDIVMLPGKPYSVICYASVEEANNAYEHLQAWQLRPANGPTPAVILYLSFINEVPRPRMTGGQQSLPPGLILIRDFIDTEMEKELMRSILWEQQDDPQEAAQQTLKHRRVRHFGYEFNYATNNVDKTSPLPDPIPQLYVDVIDRIMATGLVQHRPDQITVNEYQPGQGIPPHVDTHSAFQDAIVSLSFGSQVLMEFSNPVTGRHVPVLLPQRSILIMTGEARYLWSHGITPRKSDIIPAHVDVTNGCAASNDVTETDDGLTLVHRGVRMSFTFRAVRGSPCHCGYPSHCDSQQGALSSNSKATNPPPPSLPTTDIQALHLEAAHVHQVYDNIAGHFSETRHKPWPQVVGFLQELPMGSILLDVGCGNGKYLNGNPSVFSIGCDRSVKLVEICSQRQFQAFSCDGLNLPVRSSSMDACICIAVIHHFSTKDRRLAAIKEIARVLRSGGLGLIYVWAKEQKRDEKKSHYISTSTHKKRNAKKAVSGTNKAEAAGIQDEDSESSNDCMSCGAYKEENQRTDSISSDDTKSERHKTGSGSSASSVNSRTRTANQNDLTRSNIAGGDDELHLTDHAPPLKLEVTSSSPNTKEKTVSNQAHEASCDGERSTIQGENSSQVLSVHTNRTEFESQDILVPWHLKKKTNKDNTPPQGSSTADEEDAPVYHRFYHVFQEGELEGLCGMVSGVKIESSHYDQGNWGVVISKI